MWLVKVPHVIRWAQPQMPWVYTPESEHRAILTPANYVNSSHTDIGPPSPHPAKELGTNSHRQVTCRVILDYRKTHSPDSVQGTQSYHDQNSLPRANSITASPACSTVFPPCLRTCSHPFQHLGSPRKKAAWELWFLFTADDPETQRQAEFAHDHVSR